LKLSNFTAVQDLPTPSYKHSKYPKCNKKTFRVHNSYWQEVWRNFSFYERTYYLHP